MTLSIVRRAMSSCLLLACLSLGSGCSYAFVHGPARPDLAAPSQVHEVRSGTESCTTSNALPVVDTVLGLLLVGAGGFLIVDAATQKSGTCTYPSLCFNELGSEVEAGAIGIGAGAVALGTVFIASAVTGYARTADCRRLELSPPRSRYSRARHLLDLDALAEVRP